MSASSHPSGLEKAAANLSGSQYAAISDTPSLPTLQIEKLELPLSSSLLFFLSLQVGLSPEQDAVYVLMYVLAAEALHVLRASEVKTAAFIFTGVMGLGAAASLLARSLHSFHRPQQPIVRVKDGEPRAMFFHVQTSHTRLFPKVHSLLYPFMWTGIPIGFRGNIGGVLSCERKIERLRPAWFTVDACDYMRRGNDHIGLEGKLHEFLISLGADPNKYPYAYLLTVAKFSGHAFNPVSFWYLYSPGRTLSAVILEVNNTFGERHPYFLDCSSTPTSTERNAPTRFTSTFRKDFFVSPFSDRSGSYSLVTNDPLYPNMTGTGPIKLCLTLSSNEGKPKVVARVYSNGDPIDPTTLSWWQVQRFAMSKAWDTWATEPRTVYQAGLLMLKRGLIIFTVPEPLRTTISRKAKNHEVIIERAFRHWLKNQAEKARLVLVVQYTAAGIPGATTELLQSPTRKDEAAEAIFMVKLSVLTPLFYARMVKYGSVSEALKEEARQGQTLEIEGLEQLLLCASVDPPAAAGARFGLSGKVMARSISFLRRAPKPLHTGEVEQAGTPVQSHQPHSSTKDDSNATPRGLNICDLSSVVSNAKERDAYQMAVVKLLLSDWLALGNMDLLDIECFILRVGLMWMVGDGMRNVLHNILS